MRRREFTVLLGGVAAWPLAARAQQAALPVVGFLHPDLADAVGVQVAGFKEGLAETGYVDGSNVAIEYRWGSGQYDRLPALAAELVRQRVTVITALTPSGALAAKQATTSIPIVFLLGSDPVKLGLVESLNRPGGNITGATFLNNVLDAKRLDLLHRLVPGAKLIAMLLNPKNPNAESETKDTQAAAQTLGLEIVLEQASNEQSLDDSIADVVARHAGALLIAGDAFINNRADRIAQAAMRNALPTCFINRETAALGGLMSYGADLRDSARQAGNYVARILKGEKPGDLPVQAPNKYELVINLRTAKALGFDVPSQLLGRADEVIE